MVDTFSVFPLLHSNEAAKILGEGVKPIKIAKVNCTEEELLCFSQLVDAYPTLKIFKNQQPETYHGQRSTASLVSNVKK